MFLFRPELIILFPKGDRNVKYVRQAESPDVRLWLALGSCFTSVVEAENPELGVSLPHL